MSQLVAVIFDDESEARKARQTLKEIQQVGQLTLNDAATLARDPDGKLHVHNEIDRDVKWGAGIGSIFGVMFSFLFPVVGLVIGAAGGALVGKLLDRGLDRSFVNDVGEHLKAGASALMIAVDDSDADALVAAFEPYRGTLYQTSLDPEIEQEIGNALK